MEFLVCHSLFRFELKILTLLVLILLFNLKIKRIIDFFGRSSRIIRNYLVNLAIIRKNWTNYPRKLVPYQYVFI